MVLSKPGQLPAAPQPCKEDLGTGTGLRALGVPLKAIPHPEWLHPNVTLIFLMPPPFGGRGDAARPWWQVGSQRDAPTWPHV